MYSEAWYEVSCIIKLLDKKKVPLEHKERSLGHPSGMVYKFSSKNSEYELYACGEFVQKITLKLFIRNYPTLKIDEFHHCLEAP